MLRKSTKVCRLVLLLAVSATPIAQSQPPTQSGGAPPAGPVSGAAEHPYIYPKNGQTQQQQWTDRYACHNWAKTQSGFDPTRRATEVPPQENASTREEYRRAMAACLEARGYSVSEVAPPSAPPPSAPPPRKGPSFEQGSSLVPEFKYHPLAVQFEGGYTVTEGEARRALDNGWNAGVGITWFPTSALPLGLRVDGTYNRFRENYHSLNLASQATGTNVAFGYESLYGGDVDLELDLRMGPRVKEYFFGGIGWYREHTAFKQVSFERGVGCFEYCCYGYFPFVSTVEQNTSGWLKAWNAGMGFEFALADPASFFIEARYLRLSPASSRMEFVPIRIGLRF
jgi:opacity protein-like surface antigen